MSDLSPNEKPDRRALEEMWFDISEGNFDPEKLRWLNSALRNDAGLREHLSGFLIDDVILEKELEVTSIESEFKTAPISNTFSHSIPSWTWTTCFCAVLVAVTAGQLFLYQRNYPPKNNSQDSLTTPTVQALSNRQIHLATLVHSELAQWETPLSRHGKLSAGKYCLKSGKARLIMFNGNELVVDSQHGATEFEFVSPRLVLLHSGTIIARVHEKEIGFTIETPTTQLVDVGTEFAVTVSEQGSQVEVLEGAVHVKPLEGQAAMNYSLFASQDAFQFSNATEARGKPVKGDNARLREIQKAVRSNATKQSLPLAFEYFENLGPAKLKSAGNGWDGSWRWGSFDGPEATLVTKSGPLAGTPAWLPDAGTRYLIQPASSVHYRNLLRPLALDTDADYYISLLIRKLPILENEKIRKDGVGLTLFSSAQPRKSPGLGFSLDGTDRFTVWNNEEKYQGGKYGEPDTTYFVVLKISASNKGQDNLFLKAYVQDDAIDFVEPKRWDVVGHPGDHDFKLDRIGTWSRASCFALIDEIRVGDTWQSVTPVR